MLHRSTALTVIALLAGGLLTSAPAAATDENCWGRPATQVGTGPDVHGTPGDDVIVTGPSALVDSGAGDDVVCVTPNDAFVVHIFAGAGDDVIDVSASTNVTTRTALGSGVDRFIGGPGYDQVDAAGADDDVSGGAGNDWMMLDVRSVSTPGRYDGGPGNDVISVWSATLGLEVDLDDQVLVDGVPAASVTRFRRASVVAPRVVLRGNGAGNGLTASGCDVRMYGEGGNDFMSASDADLDAPQFDCRRTAWLSGGRGADAVRGSAGKDVVMGNAGDDGLWGRESADLLLGNRGDDRLVGDEGPDVLRGNAGNDLVHGSPGNDDLFGNRGWDSASGGPGRDRCVTELARRC